MLTLGKDKIGPHPLTCHSRLFKGIEGILMLLSWPPIIPYVSWCYFSLKVRPTFTSSSAEQLHIYEVLPVLSFGDPTTVYPFKSSPMTLLSLYAPPPLLTYHLPLRQMIHALCQNPCLIRTCRHRVLPSPLEKVSALLITLILVILVWVNIVCHRPILPLYNHYHLCLFPRLQVKLFLI